MSKIRIILVDDHHVVRSGLRRLLELGGDIEVVAEASSGEQACQIYTDFVFDVLVMDISMPGMGGIEALQQVMQASPKTKVVIFSMHENATFATQVLTLGARGYVLKSGFADDLLLAVREAFADRIYISPVVAQKMALQAVSGQQNPVEKLSAKEFKVFKLLVDGLSIEAIAKTLHISYKTAANYQTIIKQKLGIASAVELVRLAIQYGIIVE